MSIKKQLQEELATVNWQDIKPHAQRDGVIVVTENLDLITVGEAIATDNSQRVGQWIAEALIAKPNADQLGLWNSKPQLEFETLIVQPFVLVKEIAPAAD